MSNKTPVGYQQITALSASVGFTLPTNNQGQNADLAIATPQTQAVRWRDDGTAPTATVGYLLPVGSELVYDGDLTKLRFIEVVASAAVNVCYYRSNT